MLETVKELDGLTQEDDESSAQPGLVLIFSGVTPHLLPFSMPGGKLELGRELLAERGILDDRMSRRHVAVQQAGDLLRIQDLGSTNGAFLGGQRLPQGGVVEVRPPAVLRVGRTLFKLVSRLSVYEEALARPVVQGSLVTGPTLHACLQQVRALARGGYGLFLRGESGAGKEIAARVFHESGPRSAGPLVTVNCATIPKDLAERLLFGTVRGAYSGANADAPGYLQAANGGTLFLDEVAELDLPVQAKLLRALETREVTPLGGTRPQSLQLGLCAATLRDLRQAVTENLFREDLYYRIGRPEVRLPPLRERLEEVPFFVLQVAHEANLIADPAMVEECLLRPWPGNVRELLAELRAAAALAVSENSKSLAAKFLAAQAGRPIASQSILPELTPAEPEPPGSAVQAVMTTLGLARKTVLKLFDPGELEAIDLRAQQEGLSGDALAALLRASAAAALRRKLESFEYNQSVLALALKTSRTTLIKLMSDLGIPRAQGLSDQEIQKAIAQAQGDLTEASRQLGVSVGALKRRLTSPGPKTGE